MSARMSEREINEPMGAFDGICVLCPQIEDIDNVTNLPSEQMSE